MKLVDGVARAGGRVAEIWMIPRLNSDGEHFPAGRQGELVCFAHAGKIVEPRAVPKPGARVGQKFTVSWRNGC